MAKSLRSKRKKRLRTLRREIVEPFYEKKEEAKLAAQEAALAAPKVPVKVKVVAEDDAAAAAAAASTSTSVAMEVEMADGRDSTGGKSKSLLKPVGGIGKKKSKKKLKVKGRKGGNKIRRRKI